MADAQERLQEFARSVALPYLMELPKIKPHADDQSFVLVGSAAAGLCREDSDVDVAIVCDKAVYNAISAGESWSEGRPAEVSLQGTQLHYYAIAFQYIEEKAAALDDGALYLYGSAVILSDPSGHYETLLNRLRQIGPEVRKERLEGKLDMLLRRMRALEGCASQGDDLLTAEIYLEIIRRTLKIVALLDDVPFNPRKRLVATALTGSLGRRLEGAIRGLFSRLGDVESLKRIIVVLCQEAESQGFRIGLDQPDRRQMEA